MINDPELEHRLDTIRRLRALARDPGASPAEAQVAYSRAQKLIDKYSIEDWQLDESVLKKTIRFDDTHTNDEQDIYLDIIRAAQEAKHESENLLRKAMVELLTGMVMFGLVAGVMQLLDPGIHTVLETLFDFLLLGSALLSVALPLRTLVWAMRRHLLAHQLFNEVEHERSLRTGGLR
ncbi:MAG: DUF2786 domain-containing protein [Bifidobacteriaceae bacterium]|jgi:hypothetical protein|nr:DUF2786 domain-containing protein [Bifidobacteriaceae bacterium]MCI1914387.1 DUF2786 domain-containing protein [Bifidobacteriaceae bacterium]MCI1935839.1 DUF2786 domain-containing protein [Bifidobacteriaceae bacterium]